MKSAAATLAIPQVVKATEQFLELIELQAIIMEAQSKFKKPDLAVLGKRSGEIFNEMDTV